MFYFYTDPSTVSVQVQHKLVVILIDFQAYCDNIVRT